MTNIYFSKLKEGAKIPCKRDEDAGYDIYPCFDEDYILLNPGETKLIPTGIASAFPSGYVMILKERGSTGVKGIGQRAGVIDSGFRGEWFIPITNHDNDRQLFIAKSSYIKKMGMDVFTSENKYYLYEKAISQAILLPVPKTEVKEVSYDYLAQMKSERGVNALGSSGK